MKIEETDEEPLFSSGDLEAQIRENMKKLNNAGLANMADYSDYLASKLKYCNYKEK